MPNRIVKEELIRDARIDQLDAFEECVYFRLLLALDDYGNIDARPGYLRSALFPTKGGVEAECVAEACERMRELGILYAYEAERGTYFHLNGFEQEQKLKYPRAKFPKPEESEISAEARRMRMLEQLHSWKGREGGL